MSDTMGAEAFWESIGPTSATCRMRAKVARNGIDAAKAARLAEFNRELLARYGIDHVAWGELTDQVRADVARVDAEIAKRCEELGIRPEFRPKLYAGWAQAGENASKERRADLRRMAALELDAMGKAAKQGIDAAELETITAIVAVGMGSEARELLAAMPTVEELIPALDVQALEDKAPATESRGYVYLSASDAVGGGL